MAKPYGIIELSLGSLQADCGRVLSALCSRMGHYHRLLGVSLGLLLLLSPHGAGGFIVFLCAAWSLAL